MKICFIEEGIYPWKIGGAEIFDYYFIRNLPDKWSPSYISTKSWSDSEIDNIKIPAIKPTGIFVPLMIFLILLKKGKKFDYIHLRYSRSRWFFWWPYPLLNRLTGLKYIITIHGGGVTAWNFRRFYNWMFQRADFIFGVSKRICKEYERRSKRQIIPILPLIPFSKSNKSKDETLKNLRLDKREFILLFVGSLKQLKNPKVLIDALLELGDKYLAEKRVKLIFVGDGPLRKGLEKFVLDLSKTNHVRFEGNILREKIPYYYKIANLYVIASNYEGTPLSLLEAMFNKLPIIASDSPGINNILTHEVNSLLFNPRDAKELSKRLKQVIENKSLRRKIAAQAENYYKKKYQFTEMIYTYKRYLEQNEK